MIAGRTIVCIASNWNAHPTGKHHIMRMLARHDNDVIWVNFHASRRPQLNFADFRAAFARLWETRRPQRAVSDAIRVLSPFVIPWPESRAARRINVDRIDRAISNALSAQAPRPTQLWLFTPDLPELIDRRRYEATVYCCVDDFAAFAGYNAELIRTLEADTCRRADVVFATSEPLREHCRPLSDNLHLVPHGVDTEHFAKARQISNDQLPRDIAAIPRPILGYFGLISDYVDLELLRSAALARPDRSIVMIGDSRVPLDLLRGLENIHILGGRPYTELPAYAACFDVGLIPFRMNRLIHAVNPIKLREYLAAGLPVVSAPMPAVLSYAPAVRTAETVDEFIRACDDALDARESFAHRQALVRSEAWEARVAEMSTIVLSSTRRSFATEGAG